MRIRSRIASSEPSWDLCVLSVVPKGFWGVGCHCHAARMEREPVNISLPLSFTTHLSCSKNISAGVFLLFNVYFVLE